jgi:SAM-dependent methyltransferase
VPGDDPWEEHAGWWQAHFTDGADPEYEEQILPMVELEFAAGATVLDLGCGEGQVARRLASDGRRVIGVDPARAQAAAAAARGGGPLVAQGGAEAICLRDGAVDGVLVCLALEHIEDLDGVVAEIARVLQPDGRLALYLNHPLFQCPDSGWVDDHVIDPPERYWRVGAYLPESHFVDQVQRGVFIRFFHRPLSVYVNTLARHGFVIDGLDEPPPPPGFVARADEYAEAAGIPRLLVLRARRCPVG